MNTKNISQRNLQKTEITYRSNKTISMAANLIGILHRFETALSLRSDATTKIMFSGPNVAMFYAFAIFSLQQFQPAKYNLPLYFRSYS